MWNTSLEAQMCFMWKGPCCNQYEHWGRATQCLATDHCVSPVVSPYKGWFTRINFSVSGLFVSLDATDTGNCELLHCKIGKRYCLPLTLRALNHYGTGTCESALRVDTLTILTSQCAPTDAQCNHALIPQEDIFERGFLCSFLKNSTIVIGMRWRVLLSTFVTIK